MQLSEVLHNKYGAMQNTQNWAMFMGLQRLQFSPLQNMKGLNQRRLHPAATFNMSEIGTAN